MLTEAANALCRHDGAKCPFHRVEGDAHRKRIAPPPLVVSARGECVNGSGQHAQEGCSAHTGDPEAGEAKHPAQRVAGVVHEVAGQLKPVPRASHGPACQRIQIGHTHNQAPAGCNECTQPL